MASVFFFICFFLGLQVVFRTSITTHLFIVTFYVHVCICVHVQTCVQRTVLNVFPRYCYFVCVCLCMWGQRSMWGVFLCGFLPYFLRQDLLLNLELTDQGTMPGLICCRDCLFPSAVMLDTCSGAQMVVGSGDPAQFLMLVQQALYQANRLPSHYLPSPHSVSCWPETYQVVQAGHEPSDLPSWAPQCWNCKLGSIVSKWRSRGCQA